MRRLLPSGRGGRRLWECLAAVSLGLDFLYLVLYSNAIGLGCVLVATALAERASPLALIGIVLAWAQYGAALLDVIENCALIQLLTGDERAVWPVLAHWSALLKFALVVVGLTYVGFGAVMLLF